MTKDLKHLKFIEFHSIMKCPFLLYGLVHRGLTIGFLLLQYSVESLFLFISFLYLDVYLLGEDISMI